MPVRTNIISSGGTRAKFRMFTTRYNDIVKTLINTECGSQHAVKFKLGDDVDFPERSYLEIKIEGSDRPDTTTTEYTYSGGGGNPYYAGGQWRPAVDGREIVYSLPPCKYVIIKTVYFSSEIPIEVEIL